MLLILIDRIFLVFMIMLFVRIIGSWLPELRNYRLMQFVIFYTDPYLNLFRKIIPPIGMIDFSPILAFLSLGIIEHSLKWVVYTLFYS